MNIKHSLEKSKYADASAKKKIIMQKSISNNIVNSDWEKRRNFKESTRRRKPI